VLDRQRGQPLEEGKRRKGARRVVGIVDPEKSDPLPGFLLDRVDIGQEA
jgi:hypothetical protein